MPESSLILLMSLQRGYFALIFSCIYPFVFLFAPKFWLLSNPLFLAPLPRPTFVISNPELPARDGEIH